MLTWISDGRYKRIFDFEHKSNNTSYTSNTYDTHIIIGLLEEKNNNN